MGVPLETTTTVFAIALAVVFVVRYRREGTLSIHSIDTTGREAYYWLAATLFALAIGAVAIAHRALGLGAVVSFWIAYVLTRPLGASIGDYLSQPTGDGGIGLLAVTRKDVIEPVAEGS